jgi:hypothetical protein
MTLMLQILSDLPNLIVSMAVVTFWLRVEHRLTRLETRLDMIIGQNDRIQDRMDNE